jgi:hypothetical protein
LEAFMKTIRGCPVLLLLPMTAEVRWRFLAGRMYALAAGGTLLYPEGDGTLRPGAFASVGLGVDHAQ